MRMAGHVRPKSGAFYKKPRFRAGYFPGIHYNRYRAIRIAVSQLQNIPVMPPRMAAGPAEAVSFAGASLITHHPGREYCSVPKNG
jgi:hypothetical protein